MSDLRCIHMRACTRGRIPTHTIPLTNHPSIHPQLVKKTFVKKEEIMPLQMAEARGWLHAVLASTVHLCTGIYRSTYSSGGRASVDVKTHVHMHFHIYAHIHTPPPFYLQKTSRQPADR